MIATTPCPDFAQYQALWQGRPLSAEQEPLLEHLGQCPSCWSRLEEQTNCDPLLEVIRTSRKGLAHPIPEPALRLMEQLSQVAPDTECGRVDSLVTPHQPDGLARHGRPLELTFLAPPEAADELGRLGRFRVREILGHGGMGVVFLAEDPRLGRKVALKTMLPHFAASTRARARFQREARTVAALQHEHVVPIYEVDEANGVPYLAMPLLKGRSLASHLREANGHPLPVADAVRIAREIAEALAATHAAGLVHRDIKPSNVWLEDRGEEPGPRDEGSGAAVTAAALAPCVKILDFGLARPADCDEALTHAGEIVGTPAFMAPEQGRGEPAEPSSDLFSLGCVLYVMVTGQIPFRGNDAVSTLVAVATLLPTPPRQLNPTLPDSVSTLVMDLLAKTPAERPASAERVVQRLKRIEEELSTPADEPHRRRSRRWGLVATGLLLACLIGAVVVLRPASKSKLVIETDRSVQVMLLQGGELVRVVDTNTNRTFEISPGEYEMIIVEVPEGTRTRAKQFTLKRAGKEVVNVRLELDQRADSKKEADTYTNSLGMKFVRVPKGKFWMGGGKGTEGKEDNMEHDYYLGVYEVTQGEWTAVMESNPSQYARAGEHRELVKDVPNDDLKRFPVENVKWADIQPFLAALNARDERSGWQYRLPTEREWEYACRGGADSNPAHFAYDYYFERPTNTLLPEQANVVHPKCLERTCKVGSHPPNRLGLHDMHGNVPEWCEAPEVVIEGKPHRVIRGGGWSFHATLARAGAQDLMATIDYRSGLRLVAFRSQPKAPDSSR